MYGVQQRYRFGERDKYIVASPWVELPGRSVTEKICQVDNGCDDELHYGCDRGERQAVCLFERLQFEFRQLRLRSFGLSAG